MIIQLSLHCNYLLKKPPIVELSNCRQSIQSFSGFALLTLNYVLERGTYWMHASSNFVLLEKKKVFWI